MTKAIIFLMVLVSRFGQTVSSPIPGPIHESDSLSIACSPEKPTIQTEEIVPLRAWARSSADRDLQYSWIVTTGVIKGQGREVEWNLQGARAGIYRADVDVRDRSGATADCTIRVAVFEPDRGPNIERETGRAFLLKGQKEADGYGLYSYLLLGSRPTDMTHDQLARVMEAYLRTIESVSALETGYYRRSKLNITYLPLDTAPKRDVGASWLLDHYDYPRARQLLDSLPGERKDGIYIVSCRKPLGGGPNPPYLLQDLSTVPSSPPDLISWWIREFLNQAAQEHFWEPKKAELLLLKMRTTIAVLANGLPEVQHAVTSWIKWVQ